VILRTIGHNRRKEKGLASLQALDYLVAGACYMTRLLME
jgi:hypothetical protein